MNIIRAIRCRPAPCASHLPNAYFTVHAKMVKLTLTVEILFAQGNLSIRTDYGR
jgi:hypothetical protein